MDALYDRMVRFDGWGLRDVQRVHLVVVGGEVLLPLFGKAAVSLGFERITILGADSHLAERVAAEAMEHNPRAFVEARRLLFPAADRPIVALVDLSSPAAPHLRLPPGGVAIGFGRTARGIEFGTDLAAIRSAPGLRPLESRAEVSILVGELLCASLGLAGVYRDPITGAVFPGAPVHATVPLSPLPDDALGPLRIHLSGAGGALGHGALAAIGLDLTLKRALLGTFGSVVEGCDDDVVRRHNQARQLGYRRAGGRKAPDTEAWIRGALLPGADVSIADEKCRAEHLDGNNIDVLLAFVDSWSARRGIGALASAARVPALVSAGASFLGGFVRLVDGGTACTDHGVEKLSERDDGLQPGCADSVAAPSSILPQLFIGGLTACMLRSRLAGEDVDPRGFDVHLMRHGDDGLRFSTGSPENRICPCRSPE